MKRRPPRSTLTDTLFPSTSRFRAHLAATHIPPVADQRRNQRIDLVRERLVAAAHAAAEFEPVEIERLARAQVDHAADTALDQIGGRDRKSTRLNSSH